MRKTRSESTFRNVNLVAPSVPLSTRFGANEACLGKIAVSESTLSSGGDNYTTFESNAEDGTTKRK